jgi:hypothetical protein
MNVIAFGPARATGQPEREARAQKRALRDAPAPAAIVAGETQNPPAIDAIVLPRWNVPERTEVEPLQADVESPARWLDLVHQEQRDSAWNSLFQERPRVAPRPRVAGLLHKPVKRQLAVAIPAVVASQTFDRDVGGNLVPPPPPVDQKSPPTPLSLSSRWDDFQAHEKKPRVSCAGDITPLAPVYEWDLGMYDASE